MHQMFSINKVTIVGTAFNEEGNVAEFCRQADAAMKELGYDYEIVVVDDGSVDGTSAELERMRAEILNLKVVTLQRNFGQTAALDAGFGAATGDVILVFDADLQQDPREIARILVDKIREGFDVVSGHRVKRKHAAVYRLIAWIGYWFRRVLLSVPLRDTACSPNAYRREVLKDLNLHGEMHRFLVPIFYWRGYKVVEAEVPHRKRGSGTTKYSVFKSLRAFLDILVIKFWMGFSVQPMHLFGGTGFIIGFFGFCVGVYVVVARSLNSNALLGSTIPLFSVLLMLMGTQLVFFGVLADIMMRVYYRDHPTYYVKNKRAGREDREGRP